MDGSIRRFSDCKILRNGDLLKNEDLWVRDGVILDPKRIFWDEKRMADQETKCEGLIAAPGFIDAQINGAIGYDFSSNVDDIQKGIREVAKLILSHGVTAFYPTIVSSSPEQYQKILPSFVSYEGSPDEAAVLGLHLEGPFISREKRGAHHEDAVWNGEGITMDMLRERFGSLEGVKIITVAPELEGMLEVIEELKNRTDIVISLGHSMSKLQGAEEAVNKGARFITHLFNAMLPFHHRDPGIVGLLASNDLHSEQIYYGMIVDDVHTDPAALRIAYRANPNGLVLVTDAMAAMGLADGVHSLGSQIIQVKGKEARLAGSNVLAGSVATMEDCVKIFKKRTGCSKSKALEAASLHPAKMLGLDNRGNLNYGSRADFILLDNKLNVHKTYIEGREVFSK